MLSRSVGNLPDSPSDEDPILVAYLSERDIRCPHCGYNLRLLTHSRCPECGSQIRLTVSVVDSFSMAWVCMMCIICAAAGSARA